ncbi:hypothetical protein BU17DRAFT_70455 [Hysterangium stoloniferum]|nr:hypothetical protein BU17DRAFT_70455 [Hysterangium stoloniferum]
MGHREIETIALCNDWLYFSCTANSPPRVHLCWGLQIVTTEKGDFGNLTVPVGRSVSTLLILRLFLDLRERLAHPNGIFQTREPELLSSFKAAIWNISNAVIEDLGDPENDDLFASQTTSDESASRQALPATTEADNNDSPSTVNPVEFLSVTGDLDEREGIQGTITV